MRWLVATVAETVPETASAVTLRLDVPGWPGQYVYADAPGAVVIPEGEVDDVLAEARKIVAEDEAFRARIGGEATAERSTGAIER